MMDIETVKKVFKEGTCLYAPNTSHFLPFKEWDECLSALYCNHASICPGIAVFENTMRGCIFNSNGCLSDLYECRESNYLPEELFEI